jgi:hypothetical protein
MTSSFYSKFKEGLLQAQHNLLISTIKAALLDLSVYGLPISLATNANPINITTVPHSLANDDSVIITGVKGNTAANGLFYVANVTTSAFDLMDPATGKKIAGNGVYTSGGRVIPISKHQFRSDLTGVAALSTTFTSKTVTLGIFNAASISFTSVPAGNPCGAIAIYKDTGNAATDNLIAYIEDLSGLPVTPNGATIPLSWDTGRNKIFAT